MAPAGTVYSEGQCHVPAGGWQNYGAGVGTYALVDVCFSGISVDNFIYAAGTVLFSLRPLKEPMLWIV